MRHNIGSAPRVFALICITAPLFWPRWHTNAQQRQPPRRSVAAWRAAWPGIRPLSGYSSHPTWTTDPEFRSFILIENKKREANFSYLLKLQLKSVLWRNHFKLSNRQGLGLNTFSWKFTFKVSNGNSVTSTGKIFYLETQSL